MAMMAVTQKINRAAFDIFIRVFVSLRASNQICSTDVQLTPCSQHWDIGQTLLTKANKISIKR